MKQSTVFLLAALLIFSSLASGANEADLDAQVQALQQRVAELEAKQSDQSVAERNAELVRQMLSEMSSDSSNLAADTGVTAGYDKRFFIKSTDDQFKLEFDTRMQFRHSYLLTDDADKNLLTDGTRATSPLNVLGDEAVDSSGHDFELERARVYLKGHVLKDLKYEIAFSGEDEGPDEAYLRYYWLAYEFIPEFGLRAGKFKAPFNKQETTSSGRQMMVDRSLANEVFNLDRVTGIEAFGTLDMGEIKPTYRAAIFNAAQQNEAYPAVEHDNGLDLAARLAIPLMGATTEDFINESDLAHHENPVMQVGCSIAHLNDRDEGTFVGGKSDHFEYLGKSAVDGKADIFELGGVTNIFAADIAYKYQGLSVILEGFLQCVDGDSGEDGDEADFGNAIRSGIDGHELDNYGWYAQAGYFIVPKTFELVSRVGAVCVDNTNDSYEYAGGWNWYLAGQDLKLSMDVTYIDDLPITSSSPNFYGVQNNALFLIRTQLQFQF